MNNRISKIKNNLFQNKTPLISFIILLLSIFWLKEVNYLFYNTLDSPDINKYIIYFDHFFNNQTTNKEHGLLYYYLHSLNYSFFYSDLNNFQFFIHKSVQQVNFYIFVYGLIGYYFLLKYLNFSLNVIFSTLLFINFFPPSISMRLVYKPEILAFALLPWIIFLFERYLKSKNILNLILSIPMIVTALTIKGNVLAIISIYLFFSYFKIFLNTSKKTLAILFFISLMSFTALSLENNEANGRLILDIQSGSTIEENYNYKAPYSIIYKTDLYGLISSPIKHDHAKSFIGITLLETSGDYFDLYWDNNASEFFKNRKKIFSFVQSNEIKMPVVNDAGSGFIVFQQRMTDVYLHQLIGLLLSIFLFYSLLSTSAKKGAHRKFLIASFIGMGVLLFHSITGIPKNNFDPLVGDTLKPLYYSFVLIFSFAFLIASKLSKKSIRFFYLAIYCLLIIFVLGFPKSSEFEPDTNMVNKIQASIFCPVEKIIFKNNQDLNSITCGVDNIAENRDTGSDLYSNNINHKPINLLFVFLNFLSSIYIIFSKKLSKNRSFSFFIKN
tara:strand:- start:3378 stop:5039 length:1662 start_codon:yes stop_codon:yes gene_type:complete